MGALVEFTIFLTQRCNLACKYCYIEKKPETLSQDMAKKIVDFIFAKSPQDATIDIGFFGGEPLLEFNLMQVLTKMIVNHSGYDANRVVMRVVSNGTIFTKEIADFLQENNIGLGLSFDGLPVLQDKNRPFIDGTGSSAVVEKNLCMALEWFPLMPVNAVFNNETFQHLTEIVDYLSNLGVKNIHLNPDVSSSWSSADCKALEAIYSKLGKRYLQYYLDNDPHYISLIDSKITVLLRGGYRDDEKCSMGKGELAFAPSGNIYPCERLVGADTGKYHCIGHVEDMDFRPFDCRKTSTIRQKSTCDDCSLEQYCMHWCGCTNFFATGDYNQMNYFLCYSEKAAIKAALEVIATTTDEGINFPNHLQGTPLLSIMGEAVSKLVKLN